MRHEAKKQDREFTQAVNANAQDAMATLEDLERFRPLFRLRDFDTLLGTLRVQVLQLAAAKADRDWMDKQLEDLAARTGRGQAPIINGPEDLDHLGRLRLEPGNTPRDY